MFVFFRISTFWNRFRHETNKTFRAITFHIAKEWLKLIIFTVSFTLAVIQNRTISMHSPLPPMINNIELHSMPEQTNKQLLKLQFSNAFFRCAYFLLAIVVCCVSNLHSLPSCCAFSFSFFSLSFPILFPIFSCFISLSFLVCFKHTFHHHCHCPF